MSTIVRKRREARKKILLQNGQIGGFQKRLVNSPQGERPVLHDTASNIHYELGDRVQGSTPGGIGVMLLLAQNRPDRRHRHHLHLLKVHLPYHESDPHVLNIAFNSLAGGQRIEHLESATQRSEFISIRLWEPSGFPIPPQPGTLSPLLRGRCHDP